MSRYTKGFALGLLTGAALGSVIALLYAPDKGGNTRDKLSFRLRSYLDELNVLTTRIREEKKDLVSEAKQRGSEVVLEAQQRAEDLINEAEELLRSINQAKTSDMSQN
jgi:gas vesicle protein